MYCGNEPSPEPMVQVRYQQAHMSEPLSGAVWVTPAVWRELNAAVEWRLKEREKMTHRSGKTGKKKRCEGCGKSKRWFTGIICRRCYRKGKKKRDWLNGKRKRMPR